MCRVPTTRRSWRTLFLFALCAVETQAACVRAAHYYHSNGREAGPSTVDLGNGREAGPSTVDVGNGERTDALTEAGLPLVDRGNGERTDALKELGDGAALPPDGAVSRCAGSPLTVLPCIAGKHPLAWPGRSQPSLTELCDGRAVALGGGQDPGPPFNYAEIFDPVTLTWTKTASMPFGAREHTATHIPEQNAVLVTGGGHDDTDPQAHAALFDVSGESWSTLPDMIVGRVRHRATRLQNGQVLICGTSFYGVPEKESCQLWTPTGKSSGQWSNAAPLPYAWPWFDHSQLLLPDGRVLVVEAPIARIYDPGTNAWKLGADGPYLAEGTTSSLLPGGRVFFSGGWNQSTLVKDAAIYDPIADKWQSVASAPRVHLSTIDTYSVTLNDGSVLVGGYMRFFPATGQWTDTGDPFPEVCIALTRRAGVLCIHGAAAQSTLICPK